MFQGCIAMTTIVLPNASDNYDINKCQEEKYVLQQMDKKERIKRLREHLALSKVNHEEQIMKLVTLQEANTYCVIHDVSAQKYGPLLEKFIRTKFNYNKNKAENCTGDLSKDGKNSEVKVSLGGANHTKFNFVQIHTMAEISINNLEWDRLKLKIKRKYTNLSDEDLSYEQGQEEELIIRLMARLRRKREYIVFTLKKGMEFLETNRL